MWFFWVHVLSNLLENFFSYMEDFLPEWFLYFLLFFFLPSFVLWMYCSYYAIFILQLLGKCSYRHFICSDIVWLLNSVPAHLKAVCFFLSVSIWLWVFCALFLFALVALGHLGKGVICGIVNKILAEMDLVFRILEHFFGNFLFFFFLH